VRVWAPGRVNLIGEHTDYSGGLVLPAAIQLGVTVTARATARDTVVGEEHADLATAVERELALLGRPAVGIVADVSSTIPPGAGLSSSAALEVGIALALCGAADFELPPLELARACQRVELRASGVPCGILDQAACVLGEEGAAILLDCGTLEHRSVPIPDDAVFVVLDSGIRRSLADTAYAERRAELEAGHPRRVHHVESENERVVAFVEALERADLPAAGRLLSESHASLRDDYEVSTPELDHIVEDAVANGAYGARLTGGGFGGSVLALFDRATVPPDAFVVRASAGCRLVRLGGGCCGEPASKRATRAVDGRGLL
jgi:galactokinase